MRGFCLFGVLCAFGLSTVFLSAQNMMTRNFSATLNPEVINRGDFNNDGIVDLIVGNVPGSVGQVSVYLGNGDGTFQPARNSMPGTQVNDLATADFNHDGKLDVAISSIGSSVVTVLFGNGDGTFGSSQQLTVPNTSFVESLTVGDFNHDGNPDIAVGFGFPFAPGAPTNAGFTFQPNTITIFPGQAGGTFGAPIQFTGMGNSPLRKIRVADFNADGNIDLAVQTSTDIYTLLGNGNFSFNQQLLTSYGQATDITPTDVNQDGFSDLLVVSLGCSGSCSSIDVFLSQGQNGTLQKSGTIEQTSPLPANPNPVGKNLFEPPSAPVAIDLNGDGINDIVAVDHDISTALDEVIAWLGNPDGSYQATPLVWVLGTDKGPSGLIWGDFNRDGKIDVATANASDTTIASLLNAIPQASCEQRTTASSVTACRPVDNTYSNTPVSVTASAAPGSSSVVAGQVYLDNSLAFQSFTNAVNAKLNASPGNHLLASKFWDADGKSTLAFTHVSIFNGTLGETCSTSPQTLTICMPAQNDTVGAPLHVMASVMVNAPVTAFQVYIDGTLVSNDTKLDNYVDAAFPVPAGSHFVVVKAFDAQGRTFTDSRSVTVR